MCYECEAGAARQLRLLVSRASVCLCACACCSNLPRHLPSVRCGLHDACPWLLLQRMDTSGRTVLGAGGGQEQAKQMFGKASARCLSLDVPCCCLVVSICMHGGRAQVRLTEILSF